MTIASALTSLNQDIVNARTAITNKGGTVTSGGGSSQLATDIATIPSGGSSPVITSLSITPTISAQTITAPSGTDGYSPVYVNAVTAAIDSNITAGNIKSGVPILGVTGNVVELNGETRSVSITSSAGNTFTPSSGKNAITSITVTPTNEARTVNPSTSSQSLTVNSGYSGNGTITVNPVTASIDANITAGNIKKDVQILGVTGTYEGSGGGSKYGANVNTLLGDVSANGVLQSPAEHSQLVFTGVTNISQYALYSRFYMTSVESVSFPNLTTISGTHAMDSAFNLCNHLTSASFPELTTISGSNGMYQAFRASSNYLTSASFPKLTTISGSSGMAYTFAGVTKITSISFPELTTISAYRGMGNTFYGCSMLTSASFPKLTTMSGSNCFYGTFQNCTNIANIYFNKVTTSTFASVKDQFQNMFNSSTASTSGTVNVHFPSNLSLTVSGLTGYPTFGGNSARIVLKFDLTATS